MLGAEDYFSVLLEVENRNSDTGWFWQSDSEILINMGEWDNRAGVITGDTMVLEIAAIAAREDDLVFVREGALGTGRVLFYTTDTNDDISITVGESNLGSITVRDKDRPESCDDAAGHVVADLNAGVHAFQGRSASSEWIDEILVTPGVCQFRRLTIGG